MTTSLDTKCQVGGVTVKMYQGIPDLVRTCQSGRIGEGASQDIHILSSVHPLDSNPNILVVRDYLRNEDSWLH